MVTILVNISTIGFKELGCPDSVRTTLPKIKSENHIVNKVHSIIGDMIITNGEIRMRIYNGEGKGEFKWVFAGNAHEEFNEGVLRDMASMRLGNFDIIAQATRRNKIKEKQK